MKRNSISFASLPMHNPSERCARTAAHCWRAPCTAALLCTLVHAPLLAQVRRIDERVAANADVMIRIHNMVGSVRVRAWDHDSIAVTGTVSETTADRFQIHSAGAGAKLGIWDSSNKGLGPSHLELLVPASSTVWVKTASASIDIAGVNGGLDLYSVSGDIQVEGRPREVYAESMAGTITLAADSRSARARTGSGGVHLRGTLTDVTATTVSGTIDVQGDRIQRARIETVDGGIRWQGAFADRASLDFTTHAGPVEFLLDRAASADFTVNTFEGRFDNGLGVRVQQGGSKLKGRELRFAIGAGNASILVRTFKGDVTLRQRE